MFCYSIRHDDNLKSLYVQMYKREANTGSRSTCSTCATLTSTLGLFQEKFHSEHRSHFQSRMCPCYARCCVGLHTKSQKKNGVTSTLRKESNWITCTHHHNLIGLNVKSFKRCKRFRDLREN